MPAVEVDLTPILTLLYQRTGCDFRGYRKSTLQRRAARRFHACGCSTAANYLVRLSSDPEEPRRLLKDLTIQVTEFFREPQSWKTAAKKILPPLLEKAKGEAGRTIRIWSAGCATGEEAYSLAILFPEDVPVSITGSDISEEALAAARKGIYPKEKLKNLPPSIQKKYFHPLPEACQVIPGLLERVRFEFGDLVKAETPGKFDWISCRNVLIYFSKELQEKTLAQFYRSLSPGGFLWLGKAESLWGRGQELFECVDKTAKIFRRKN